MFDASRFYSAREVWRISHAPRELVYAALHSGELKAIRRGARFLVSGSAAIEWIREQSGQRSA